MNKGNFIGTLFVVAAVAALIVFIFSGNKSYDWDIHLRENQSEPYDINLFIEVLASSYDDDFQIIYRKDEFEMATDSGTGTMIYVDEAIRLSKDHRERLLTFMERGNTAIFSSDIIPEDLIEEISGIDFDIDYYSEATSYYSLLSSFSLPAQAEEDGEDGEEEKSFNLYLTDSIANVTFLNDLEKEFSFKFIQKDSTEMYNWSGIPRELFNDYNTDNKLTTLSYVNDSLYDIISINHGKGKLIVHMNPILFSNIYFKEKSGFEYANRIASYFSEGKVYFNKKYNYISNISAEDAESQKEQIESPLSFILSQRGLKWGMYSILIMSLIYFLFAFKRRLPIIPYFQQPKNTSISFVKAMSSFYSGAKDQTILCTEMMTHFKHYLRTRYNINTQEENEKLTPIISKYSGIEENKVKVIFQHENKILSSNQSKTKRTLDLYKELESFYANCK